MSFINVNGTRLFYEDYGPKGRPAIVFSHSLFFNSSMFYHQVERRGCFLFVAYSKI
jgi:3-oxoadipate enol-lactonase